MKKLMKTLMTLGLVTVFLSAPIWGCGNSAPDVRKQLLSSWATDFALTGYLEFETKAEELRRTAGVFCDTPSAANLDVVQAAWWAARAPWKRTEIFAFGPYKENPWRLGPKIDFWPVRSAAITQILAGSTRIEAEQLGAAQKGLPALEYLLYQSDVELLLAFTRQTRRCDYLKVLTHDLVNRAREMRQAWSPEHGNYVAALADPSTEGSMFGSVHGALSEVVNRMAFTVENIRAEKLARPLGNADAGTQQPNKTESPFSGRGLEDIKDNLRGIEQLYFGDSTQDQLGLDIYVQDRGKDFGGAMQQRLMAAYVAVDAIPDTLNQAIFTNPHSVTALIETLRGLQQLIQVDIMNALGLTPRFNDNDGD